MNNIELQEKLSNDLERIELQFMHMLGKSALFGLVALPLIPGLLTMISIGVNFPQLLHVPAWAGWIFGFFAMVGIEVLGLFSIRLALRMRKYNHSAAMYDLDKAPIGQGYTTAAAYLVTVMTLTVLLKIWPDFAVWSLIPLALMGGLADWVFALNGDHNERESALRKRLLSEQELSDGADLKCQLDNALLEIDRLRSTIDIIVNDKVSFDDDKMLRHATIDIAPSVDSEAVDSADNAMSTPVDSDKKRLSAQERRVDMLSILPTFDTPSDIDYDKLATMYDVTTRTIRRDIDDLVSKDMLILNGVVKVKGAVRGR